MAEEALKMSHIVKVYSNGVMANKDVTLSVNRGEIHALSGENGAGKSTLMKILFGEEQPTSGEIYINGNQVHMTSPPDGDQAGRGHGASAFHAGTVFDSNGKYHYGHGTGEGHSCRSGLCETAGRGDG